MTQYDTKMTLETHQNDTKNDTIMILKWQNYDTKMTQKLPKNDKKRIKNGKKMTLKWY